MRAPRWSLRIAAAASLAGCATEVSPVPGYYMTGTAASHVRVDPSGFMRSVGCEVVTGTPAIGDIGIPQAAGFANYRCATVPHDSIDAARNRYRDAMQESFGGAHLTSQYNYTLVATASTCNDPYTYSIQGYHSDGVSPFIVNGIALSLPAGDYTIQVTGTQYCYNDYYYSTTAAGGGGGDGSGGDAGGTGLPFPPPPEIPVCPNADPACWKLPTKNQKNLIRHAYANQFADSSQISDTTRRRECRELRRWLDAAMATLDNSNSQIWMGSYSDPNDPHTALTAPDGSRFHIDPALMDSAAVSIAWEKELLAMLLHESAHLAPQRKTHPIADAWLAAHPQLARTTSSSVIYASDPWFRTAHSESSGELCVKN